MTRDEMISELREIEGSYSCDITSEKQKRARYLVIQLQRAKCRCCGKEYNFTKSRAEYQGYCSASCQHKKAKALGYRKSSGEREFEALKRRGEVGTVFVIR